MRIPSITNDQATDAWNSLSDHGVFENAGSMVLDYIDAEDQDSFSDLDLMALTEELENIKFRFKGKNLKQHGGYIDAAIVEPLHRTLYDAEISAKQLSQLGFWRWMSNIACDNYFWHFIKWRYQSNIQQNWGITSLASIIEVYFYRAWLRGHKMFEPNSVDPYYYAKKGSSDVWRSHILRQEFGKDKNFVKAFLDTIYDESGTTKVGTQELRTELIPALRVWSSNATYSHLTYKENFELIKSLRIDGA
jgi:hypothetical protein